MSECRLGVTLVINHDGSKGHVHKWILTLRLRLLRGEGCNRSRCLRADMLEDHLTIC